MVRCQNCQRDFRLPEPGSTRICPYCGREQDQQQDDRWLSVARTTNLAEAGFLASVLEADGVQPRIDQHDTFSAVDGAWTATFLVRTHPDDSQRAAERIRETLEVGGEPAESYRRLETQSPGGASDDLVIWRPLALMIVAGFAIFLIGNRMRELRGRQETLSRSDLLDALEKIDRPFVSIPNRMQPNAFRLRHGERDETWLLEEDIDGDGRFDRSWQYSTSSSFWGD